MTDDLTSIHTCHAECPKPLCVAQRTIATQQEAIAEARAELWTALNYVTNPEDAPIIKKLDALLSKHGERT